MASYRHTVCEAAPSNGHPLCQYAACLTPCHASKSDPAKALPISSIWFLLSIQHNARRGSAGFRHVSWTAFLFSHIRWDATTRKPLVQLSSAARPRSYALTHLQLPDRQSVSRSIAPSIRTHEATIILSWPTLVYTRKGSVIYRLSIPYTCHIYMM